MKSKQSALVEIDDLSLHGATEILAQVVQVTSKTLGEYSRTTITIKGSDDPQDVPFKIHVYSQDKGPLSIAWHDARSECHE